MPPEPWQVDAKLSRPECDTTSVTCKILILLRALRLRSPPEVSSSASGSLVVKNDVLLPYYNTNNVSILNIVGPKTDAFCCRDHP
jgi:hypothetical protein